MKHFLGSVGVRGSVRGPFFTRHPSDMPVFNTIKLQSLAGCYT